MTAEAKAGAGQSPPKTVPYGGSGFEEVVASVEQAMEEERGLFIVLVGGTDQRRKQAVADLVAEARLNAYQFDLSNLKAERYVEMQGNLRKAFDKASESAALLCFDRAEVMLEAPRGEEEAEEDALTLADYFFQRAEVYCGVLVLCLSDARLLSDTQRQEADVIVEL